MTVTAIRGPRVVYVTAPYSRHVLVENKPFRIPSGVVHAKSPGSRHTLCGLVADSWPKYYDVPFHTVVAHHCTDCAAALARVRTLR